jgi:hypothetical protein
MMMMMMLPLAEPNAPRTCSYDGTCGVGSNLLSATKNALTTPTDTSGSSSGMAERKCLLCMAKCLAILNRTHGILASVLFHLLVYGASMLQQIS